MIIDDVGAASRQRSIEHLKHIGRSKGRRSKESGEKVTSPSNIIEIEGRRALLACGRTEITVLTIGDARRAILSDNIQISAIRTQIAGIVVKFVPEKTLITQNFIDIAVTIVISTV